MARLDSLNSNRKSGPALRLPLFAALLVLALVALGWLLARTGPGALLARLLGELLSVQSSQVTWYITRSAGWVSYLLLWLSTAWGLMVPSKILDGLLQRNFTYDFHEFLSLLALGFTGLHMGILLFDHYQPFSALQLALPFLSDYRPVWVTVGGISLYLSLLVTVTFYLRRRIGMRAFRAIHVLSLVAFAGAAVHGLFAGADSSLPAALVLYLGTFLSVVFLSAYWLLVGRGKQKALA